MSTPSGQARKEESAIPIRVRRNPVEDETAALRTTLEKLGAF
jgi:hypothetical protein